MKGFNLWALTLLVILIFSCKGEDEYGIAPQDCTINDFVGTWVWILADGEPMPYNEITFEQFTTEKSIYWKVVDNKWTKTESTVSVKDGVLTFKDEKEETQYNIVNIDNRNIVLICKDTKIRYSGEKVFFSGNQKIQGTWLCDAYTINNDKLTNFEACFEDTTFTVSYDGSEPITGKYAMLNDFCFYSRSNMVGGSHFSFDMDKTGPIATETVINVDGTITKNVFHRKPMSIMTLDDVVGTWLTTTKNGEDISWDKATICYAADNSGRSTISSIENNKWVSKDVAFTLDNNVITRTIDGQTDQATILYFDSETIIWKDHTSEDAITCKKIGNPNDGKERLAGLWKTSEPFYDDDNNLVLESYSLYTFNDSVFITDIHENGEKVISKASYLVYGDYFIYQGDGLCCIYGPLEYGYDVQRKQMYRKILYEDEQGNIETSTYYKMNFGQTLAGAWIFVEKNGKQMKTYDYVVAFFNEKTSVIRLLRFKDGIYEEKSEPYTIVENRIEYKDSENLYDEIVMLSNEELLLKNGLGDKYYAIRITSDSLSQQIVGEWSCVNFKDIQTTDITHVFDKNGLVTFKHDGDILGYGTYRIYGRLVVMRSTYNGEEKTILWSIKHGKIENKTMTFIRCLDEDGTVVENILTKIN